MGETREYLEANVADLGGEAAGVDVAYKVLTPRKQRTKRDLVRNKKDQAGDITWLAACITARTALFLVQGVEYDGDEDGLCETLAEDGWSAAKQMVLKHKIPFAVVLSMGLHISVAGTIARDTNGIDAANEECQGWAERYMAGETQASREHAEREGASHG
jgi:hypothetical protein